MPMAGRVIPISKTLSRAFVFMEDYFRMAYILRIADFGLGFGLVHCFLGLMLVFCVVSDQGTNVK